MSRVPGEPHLTRRELQSLALAARGLRYKQIAWELGTTEHTIKIYLMRIRQKLGVGSTMEAVLWLMRALETAEHLSEKTLILHAPLKCCTCQQNKSST